MVLDAPNEVLLERDQGKMVDLETGGESPESHTQIETLENKQNKLFPP